MDIICYYYDLKLSISITLLCIVYLYEGFIDMRVMEIDCLFPYLFPPWSSIYCFLYVYIRGIFICMRVYV